MAIRLHVNVDHVATIRNARGTVYPDPLVAASECVAAGADGITAHLREDRRHIVDSDVEGLRPLLCARGTFNLEMAPTEEMIGIALRIKPDMCTLVPERRAERTTEGGLDVANGGRELVDRIGALVSAGCKVSLFVAPDPRQIGACKAMGATQVELHTGEYAHGRPGELGRLAEAARIAAALGLPVAAGHGLTQKNLKGLVALPELIELNIGHALVSDALFVGLREAVRCYREVIDRESGRR
ncbi:MAG TPA: pyridoxine 5'-phosphate synthase [Polyangiaceae bacterium]|nr:pyridoxine 5'-phosphate synthase [Polyangiaceae bacterium]